MPDDIDPSTLPQEGPVKKVKIIQKHVKKSRMMLNKSGIINVIEEESPPPAPKMIDKDPYNLSNDEFYTPKTHESQIKVSTGGFLQVRISLQKFRETNTYLFQIYMYY